MWPTWALERDILAQTIVRGFVTHGGWNSTLESLWHDMPLAPWPLYAEQHMNTFTLATPMARKRDNLVEAAELERAVKEPISGGLEGRKAREMAMEMKAAVGAP